MSRVIAVHPEWGVCLGRSGGEGGGVMLWSKRFNMGCPAAFTFRDEAIAREWLKAYQPWAFKIDGGEAMQFLPVVCDMLEGYYASIPACIEAGAPGWIVETMPTVGGMQ